MAACGAALDVVRVDVFLCDPDAEVRRHIRITLQVEPIDDQAAFRFPEVDAIDEIAPVACDAVDRGEVPVAAEALGKVGSPLFQIIAKTKVIEHLVVGAL